MVRYTAQELTAEQQAQARTNIGVGDSPYIVNISYGMGYEADKTCLEIYEAYSAGKLVFARQASGPTVYYFPLLYAMSSKSFGKRMVELKFGHVEYSNATTGKYLGFEARLDETSTETWSYKNYTITWRA